MSDHTSQQNAMSFEAMPYDKVLRSYSTSGRAELENNTLESMAQVGVGRIIWCNKILEGQHQQTDNGFSSWCSVKN